LSAKGWILVDPATIKPFCEALREQEEFKIRIKARMKKRGQG
jgi:hypothetical protein